MIENSTFTDEYDKLQKLFWEKVDCNEKNSASLPLDPLFEQWFKDIDKHWKDHPKNTSDDIHSLYKKLSTSSQFFMNTAKFSANAEPEDNADAFVSYYLKSISKVSQVNSDDLHGVNLYRDSVNSLEDTTSANDENSIDFDFNTIFQLPVENFQPDVALFSNQASDNYTDPSRQSNEDNPEFSSALEEYLKALNEYQQLIMNLLSTTAIDFFALIDSFKLNKDDQISSNLIMSTCLEMLEANYKTLILGNEYSSVYAKVINSWVLMLSKSNVSLAKLMQSTKKYPSKPDLSARE